MLKIWNDLQGETQEVKPEDGHAIMQHEGSDHLILSNGCFLRSLRDGRYIEDNGDQWTQAFEEDGEDVVMSGIFFKL